MMVKVFWKETGLVSGNLGLLGMSKSLHSTRKTYQKDSGLSVFSFTARVCVCVIYSATTVSSPASTSSINNGNINKKKMMPVFQSRAGEALKGIHMTTVKQMEVIKL